MLDKSHKVTKSQSHRVTESQSHRVTESQSHKVTKSQSNQITHQFTTSPIHQLFLNEHPLVERAVQNGTTEGNLVGKLQFIADGNAAGKGGEFQCKIL